MSDLRGAAADPRPFEKRPEPECDPESPEQDDQIGDALARALVELRAIGRDLLELANVGLDKARIGVRAGAFRLLILGWLALTATAATVVAAYFVVEGLTRGIGELLGGQAWAGRTIGGALVLLLIGTLTLIARARSRRANLARLKDKYASRTTDGPEASR
jgi:hypothetical protein